MFEPGHVHRTKQRASSDIPEFSVDIYYDVHRDENFKPILCMRMAGNVNGSMFEESFELAREEAFNFASVIGRIGKKYGVPGSDGLIARNHKDYDRMYADIKAKLGVPVEVLEPETVEEAVPPVSKYTEGHLHRANKVASNGCPVYSLDMYYDVRQDPVEGPMLSVRLVGNCNGKDFEEKFELHRDTAYNFSSVATRVVAKHGIPVNNGIIMRRHKEYDLMFADIREKLQLRSGEAVDLEHLAKDGL
ncbi:DUF5064 family protein [Pseudomonas sp. RL_15y_Pfl2_60]|uniref:DUF5064 family protein n=1 Tax=Pseudomonas sp. RL_15y_Pfl2_60 TaxID=3088709 RepID=UPI0030D94C76